MTEIRVFKGVRSGKSEGGKMAAMNRFSTFAGMVTFALFLCSSIANSQQPSCPQSSPEVRNALDRARKNAEQIDNQYVRAELLHEVAKGYARNGDFLPALEVIRIDSALMWQAANDLAKNMLRCGQASEVKSIALSLQGSGRSLMLQWLAEWEAKHNDQVESDATLAEIKDDDIRRSAQFNIITSRATTKDAKAAELAFRTLLASSQSGQEGPDDRVSQDMAIVYLLNGEIDGAIAKLEQIKGAEKVYALYVITQMLAEKNEKPDLSSFSKAILRMTHPYLQDSNQAYPLSLVATALANIGLFDEAIELANSIPDQQRRTEALVMTAVRLILAKNPSKAKELLESLPKVPEGMAGLEGARQMAWIRIAMAEANAGDGVTSLKTLELVHDPHMDSLLDWQRAYAQARIGKFVEAEATAAKIPQRNPSDERGRTFRLVAAVYAHEKGASNAMSWARQLAAPQERVSALLGIADGLLGEPNEEIPPYYQD